MTKTGEKLLFCHFFVTFSLLWIRPPKSLFRYFFVTLNFSGFRALWDLLPLTTQEQQGKKGQGRNHTPPCSGEELLLFQKKWGPRSISRTLKSAKTKEYLNQSFRGVLKPLHTVGFCASALDSGIKKRGFYRFSKGGFCRLECHAQENKNTQENRAQQYVWQSERHSQERRTILQKPTF